MSTPPAAATNPFSVVVVTYECAARLEALVETMNEHLGPMVELVVVDNASSDDPEAAAQGWNGGLRFRRLPENIGFGAANNVGVRMAAHEDIVLLNPDTELVDPGLPRLAALARRLDGLVGPTIIFPDGSPQASASGPPVGAWPWVRAFVPGALQPERVRVRTEPWRCASTVRVIWLTGCCLAAPRSRLLELGPFDTALHMYGEDLDLGLRATEAGVGVFFAPESATVIHHAGSSAMVRWDVNWALVAAAAWRAVLRRAYGRRRERLATAALVVNHALRATAKRLVGRDPTWDRRELRALVNAGPVAELPAQPSAADPGLVAGAGE